MKLTNRDIFTQKLARALLVIIVLGMVIFAAFRMQENDKPISNGEIRMLAALFLVGMFAIALVLVLIRNATVQNTAFLIKLKSSVDALDTAVKSTDKELQNNSKELRINSKIMNNIYNEAKNSGKDNG